jgi:hypothetical protein
MPVCAGDGSGRVPGRASGAHRHPRPDASANPNSRPLKEQSTFMKLLPMPKLVEYVSKDKIKHTKNIENEWKSTTDDPRMNGQVILDVSVDGRAHLKGGGSRPTRQFIKLN